MRKILKLFITISSVSGQEILTSQEEPASVKNSEQEMFFSFGSANIPHF